MKRTCKLDLRGMAEHERKLGARVILRSGIYYVADIKGGIATLEPYVPLTKEADATPDR